MQKLKFAKFIFLLAGVFLLFIVLRNINIDEIIIWIEKLGLTGLFIILSIYAAAFLCDTVSWQLTFRSLPATPSWLYRLFLVRLIGEAFNNILPSFSVGGEPVKAVILKSSYQVGYSESGASLLIARTVNMLSLVLFLAVGFLLLISSPSFPQVYRLTAGAGLALIALGTLLFFLVQRYQVTTMAGTWLSRTRTGGRVEKVLHVIREMDGHLLEFYSRNHRRFGIALGLALCNWLLGVVEIYVVMRLLGYPLEFSDCWFIEAMAQLVRTGTFFIPGSIGAQEGIFMLMGNLIAGNPTLGVAIAVVRRIREIIWIVTGLIILGAWFPGVQLRHSRPD